MCWFCRQHVRVERRRWFSAEREEFTTERTCRQESGDPTVYRDHLGSDEARLVRGKEGHQSGDLFGLAHTPQAGRFFEPLALVFGQLIDRSRGDGARRDGVDTNVEASDFACQ